MIKKITKTDWFKSPLIPAPARADKVNEIIDEINGTMTLVDVNVAGDLTVAGTTTLNGDLVLGDSAADSLAINAKTTYTDVINYSNQTDITAFATGGQASATALTEEVNNITTCATAGDSVKLSAAEAGKHIYVKNSGATALDIFPATADSINALAVNLAIRIQPGSSMHFYAKDAIVWESANDTSITIPAPSTLSGGLELKAANSAGNTITTITNASMAAARTLTIPDPGAAASFVMTEGAQTINGVKTLGNILITTDGTVAGPAIHGAATNSGLFFASGIVGLSTAGSHSARLIGDGSFVVSTSGTTGGYKTSVANTIVPLKYTAAQQTIAAAAGGAISVSCYYTDIAVDAGGDAFTLDVGNVVGQMKKVMMTATAGGTGVVTGAFRGAATTLTFTNAGEYAIFIWDGIDSWLDIELASVVTLTHKPVLT